MVPFMAPVVTMPVATAAAMTAVVMMAVVTTGVAVGMVVGAEMVEDTDLEAEWPNPGIHGIPAPMILRAHRTCEPPDCIHDDEM